jgi:hypothetical protein
MKVTKSIAVVAVLAVAGGSGLYYGVPEFRTKAQAHLRNWTGWTEVARQTDPVGFVGHVKERLTADLAAMKKARGDLVGEVGKLVQHQREQEALLAHTDSLAAEFRQAYQHAVERDGFPLTVRGAGYTKEQVESQVSMLLEEAESYRTNIDKLNTVRKTAEEKLETLTVRIDRTASELAMLGTQGEIMRVRLLGDEGQRLVAAVDRLLEGNREVLVVNPVRSVPELLMAAGPKTERQPNITAARAYLGASRSVEEFAVSALAEDPTVSPQQTEKGKPAKSKGRQASRKPIFEQS